VKGVFDQADKWKQKQKQQQDANADAAAGTKKKKVTAAQLRVQKGIHSMTSSTTALFPPAAV
jgi:ubiquitin-conjugating enzyme E2 M